MERNRTWGMVRAEREEILAFLTDLSRAQWNAPSLCAGWRVRDVAVHLLVDEPFREIGWPAGLVKLARMGLSVHRANAWWVEHNADTDTARIVEVWRRSLPPGPVARFLGADTCLRASVIHHQDMRRPLGMLRTVAPERVAGVLDAIVTRRGSLNLGSRARSADLHLTCTDVGWDYGSGPLVAGPGEALMLALAGRPAGLAELHGDGVPILRERMDTETPSAIRRRN